MFRPSVTMATTMVTLFVLFLLTEIPRPARGAEPADLDRALAAIKRIGGSVSSFGGNREVDFHLGGRALTDQGLAHAAALENVASLNLRDTKITGAGLVHLKGLAKLRELHLERTAVGDEGIENLAGLLNLEYLNLYKTKITDKSLAHLSGLKKLRRLYVWQTGVTDAGVGKLEQALPELKATGVIVWRKKKTPVPWYVP